MTCSIGRPSSHIIFFHLLSPFIFEKTHWQIPDLIFRRSSVGKSDQNYANVTHCTISPCSQQLFSCLCFQIPLNSTVLSINTVVNMVILTVITKYSEISWQNPMVRNTKTVQLSKVWDAPLNCYSRGKIIVLTGLFHCLQRENL